MSNLSKMVAVMVGAAGFAVAGCNAQPTQITILATNDIHGGIEPGIASIGVTSVNLPAASIMTGMEDVVIAGGTEMMSYTASLADPTQPPTLMDAGNMRKPAQA